MRIQASPLLSTLSTLIILAVLAILLAAGCSGTEKASPRPSSSTEAESARSSPEAARPSPEAARPTPATPPAAEVAAAQPAAALHSGSAPVLTGIDVSRHSGQVDWSMVAAEGHAFAYIKSTEGVDLVDARFRSNWEGAARAGLSRGAYHFYVTEDDPEAQARFFLETVGHEPGDLLPVVDVELLGHGTRADWGEGLARFLQILESELGVKPMLYTSPRFWDDEVGGGFGEHPLWVAEYEVDAPVVPAGWTDWHLWQWKGDASVPGVEHAADLSRVREGRGLAELRLPGRAE